MRKLLQQKHKIAVSILLFMHSRCIVKVSITKWMCYSMGTVRLYPPTQLQRFGDADTFSTGSRGMFAVYVQETSSEKVLQQNML